MSPAAPVDWPPVRVLVVIGQLDVGGAETHLARTLPALRAAGVEIGVFALKRGGSLAPVLEQGGVRVFAHPERRPGLPGLVQAALFLRRVVRCQRPHVLHCFLPAAYLVGTLATAGLPLRRVMSRRSLAKYQANYPGVRWLERLLHRRMDAVLANSRAVARELLAEGVPPARLGLIYNGVPERTTPPDRTGARARLGIAHGTLVFVCVANLIAYKGHADLFEALALARPSLPGGWQLLVVGRDDGIGAALRMRAEELGIGAQLRWVGAVADVTDYLDAADIGVLASHEEGFSNAILEGMAAGLPMVVTDVGGNAEAVPDGVCGRVVPPRAPAALAAALAELAGSSTLRADLGANARARVRDSFSVPRCVELYRSLYLNLAGGRDPVIPVEARCGA